MTYRSFHKHEVQKIPLNLPQTGGGGALFFSQFAIILPLVEMMD